MYNQDTDLLFPPRLIPSLRDLRGESWRDLVDAVAVKQPDDADRLAFVLFMVRLSGCASCQADSYRAMHGCTQCATQMVRRFRGADYELVQMFHQARNDVERYLGRDRKVEYVETNH